MKHVQSIALASILYLVIIVAFFSQLFYPEPQLFLNPEYGRSDLSHFNIPVREIYSDALARGEMPLWAKDIGTGFPIYAESQIGAYFIPNLILYSQLPFWAAFNMSYIVAFFMAALGMFVFVRLLVKNDPVAFMAGLFFAFSGYYLGHTNHINMLQTAAFIPWLLLILELFYPAKKACLCACPDARAFTTDTCRSFADIVYQRMYHARVCIIAVV